MKDQVLMTKRLANSFTTNFCDDPLCGLHIVALDKDGKPICEIVMSRVIARKMMDLCEDQWRKDLPI